MRTKILPETALDVLKRNAIVYTALRRTRMGLGKFVPPRHVPGVSGRVHFNDFMFTSDAEAQQWYVEGAENVVGFIDRSLAASGRSLDEFRGVLDFGSGYGRVIRLLVQRMDPTRVYAADVIKKRWTTVRLNSASIRSIRHLTRHSEASADGSHLRNFGLRTSRTSTVACSYDLGGKASIRWHPGLHDSWPRVTREPRALRTVTVVAKGAAESDFNSKGFVYAPYEHHLGIDYGMAWHSREYVEMTTASYLPDFKQLFYESAGLDGHQDVYAYQRSYEFSQS